MSLTWPADAWDALLDLNGILVTQDDPDSQFSYSWHFRCDPCNRESPSKQGHADLMGAVRRHVRGKTHQSKRDSWNANRRDE